MMRIVRGMSPEEAPLPAPELSLGNIVRLKKPYQAEEPGGKLHEYQWGIIVEHLDRNAFGLPKVALHLYDEEMRLYSHGVKHLPAYVDFPASELILWKVSAEEGYRVVDHDLYPPCPSCSGTEQHPFQEEGRCPDCHGWGHVLQMQRLPENEETL